MRWKSSKLKRKNWLNLCTNGDDTIIPVDRDHPGERKRLKYGWLIKNCRLSGTL